MQVLDTWTKRGLEQGKREGLEEGRREGELNLILLLLNQKLGQQLPLEIQEQINSLSTTQLMALGAALLNFNSIQNLVDWLASARN